MSDMDDDQLTAWAEINPPMASAPRRGPLAPSSDLIPATKAEFGVELTACLALVAPVGMTEESRREWLAVAWETLKHLPPDILASGCRKARETCDHPAKIVPAIIAETKDWMRLRRENSRPVAPPSRQIEHRPEEEPIPPEERAEFNLLMKRMRLKTRVFEDGRCRELLPGERDPVEPAEAS